MNCPTCSSELETGQKFCQRCGTNVSAVTLPVPPAGPIATPPPAAPTIESSPPTVSAPIALDPPLADNFAIVEQTVPIPATPVQATSAGTTPEQSTPTQSTPTQSSPTNSVVPWPPVVTEPEISGEVPQWVNDRWTAPSLDPTATETKYEPAQYEPAQYNQAPHDQAPHDQAPHDQAPHDQAPHDQAPHDQAQYDETREQAIPAGANHSQLIIGPATSAVPYPAGYGPGAVGVAGRGSTVLAVIAGLAGVAAIIGAFLPVLTVSTDAPIPEVGDYQLNDLFLGTNVIIAAMLVGLCLLGGGILATRGMRIGAGLAGGAAVALVPLLIVVWGSIDLLSKAAEAHAVATAASGGGGTFFQSKQGVGLWVLIGAASLGLVALVVALVQAGADGRPRLNVAVGLGGALAAVVAAVGQMIPSSARSFGDNFDNSIATNTILYGRLAMIALVAIAGAVGFLGNNRWGIGLALGGATIWAWQWLSSLTKMGDSPLPPGFVPLSTLDGKPHVVTTIGVIALVVLAALSILSAPKNRTLAG